MSINYYLSNNCEEIDLFFKCRFFELSNYTTIIKKQTKNSFSGFLIKDYTYGSALQIANSGIFSYKNNFKFDSLNDVLIKYEPVKKINISGSSIFEFSPNGTLSINSGYCFSGNEGVQIYNQNPSVNLISASGGESKYLKFSDCVNFSDSFYIGHNSLNNYTDIYAEYLRYKNFLLDDVFCIYRNSFSISGSGNTNFSFLNYGNSYFSGEVQVNNNLNLFQKNNCYLCLKSDVITASGFDVNMPSYFKCCSIFKDSFLIQNDLISNKCVSGNSGMFNMLTGENFCNESGLFNNLIVNESNFLNRTCFNTLCNSGYDFSNYINVICSITGNCFLSFQNANVSGNFCMLQTPAQRITNTYLRASKITYCAIQNNIFCSGQVLNLNNDIIVSGCLIAPNVNNSCISGFCLSSSSSCFANVTVENFNTVSFNPTKTFESKNAYSIYTTGFTGLRVVYDISGTNFQADNLIFENGSFNFGQIKNFTGNNGLIKFLSTSDNFCMEELAGTSNVILRGSTISYCATGDGNNHIFSGRGAWNGNLCVTGKTILNTIAEPNSGKFKSLSIFNNFCTCQPSPTSNKTQNILLRGCNICYCATGDGYNHIFCGNGCFKGDFYIDGEFKSRSLKTFDNEYHYGCSGNFCNLYAARDFCMLEAFKTSCSLLRGSKISYCATGSGHGHTFSGNLCWSSGLLISGNLLAEKEISTKTLYADQINANKALYPSINLNNQKVNNIVNSVKSWGIFCVTGSIAQDQLGYNIKSVKAYTTTGSTFGGATSVIAMSTCGLPFGGSVKQMGLYDLKFINTGAGTSANKLLTGVSWNPDKTTFYSFPVTQVSKLTTAIGIKFETPIRYPFSIYAEVDPLLVNSATRMTTGIAGATQGTLCYFFPSTQAKTESNLPFCFHNIKIGGNDAPYTKYVQYAYNLLSDGTVTFGDFNQLDDTLFLTRSMAAVGYDAFGGPALHDTGASPPLPPSLAGRGTYYTSVTRCGSGTARNLADFYRFFHCLNYVYTFGVLSNKVLDRRINCSTPLTSKNSIQILPFGKFSTGWANGSYSGFNVNTLNTQLSSVVSFSVNGLANDTGFFVPGAEYSEIYLTLGSHWRGKENKLLSNTCNMFNHTIRFTIH